jgi:glycosyltransferase involved in cell wall biosynthesis
MTTSKFEIIMTTYHGSNAAYVRVAIESCITAVNYAKNVIPDLNCSILIGVDGPISRDNEQLLSDLKKKHNWICIKRYSQNRGLGPTLGDLLNYSDANFIIRMDDDDIMDERRILNIVPLHEQGFELVSGDIGEFSDNPRQITNLRKCMPKLNGVKPYLRNPLNHVATSFDRNKLLKVGNYQEIKYFEDWDLWLRAKHLRYAYTNSILVYVRMDDNAISRRTGMQSFQLELNFLIKLIRRKDPYSIMFMLVMPGRVLIRLLPSWAYKKFMTMFLRERKHNAS